MSLRAAWARFAAFYRGLSVFVLNTILLFIFVQLAGRAWFYIHPRQSHGVRCFLRDVGGAAPRVYPGRSKEEVIALLDEIWSRPVRFQPFTHFKERPYKGRFVNVSAEGWRRVRKQGPWPPARDHFNVFVFGGSTTFGYGIADEETIPSFLQEHLEGRTPRPARVYNFGCAYYYSSQERVRFEQLLVDGHVPDMAVFVDGLNDFQTRGEWPILSDEFDALVEQRAADRPSRQPRWLTLFSPRRMAAALADPPTSPFAAHTTDPQLADRLIERYLQNKKMIESVASAYGVRAVFVWQPLSVYKFDRKRHQRPDIQPQPLPGVGSQRMAERLQRRPLGPEFIWASDIQADVPDPLYVDAGHYAPNLCRAVARLTADEMEKRGFLRPATGSAASGR